ncbi:MAG: MBL fold metallo-hydrolase [Marinilabiliaceae bacterium]|jgi:glyoxylase-like metal-dependent hydrolase (beta-lactamase superfamily II)|nr:MBL fold metallo-hydrolase [Marinilabiliaceae bacterium]
MSKTRIEIFSSGYCVSRMRHVFPGLESGRGRFYAHWALIEHPVVGKILFDTGYSERFVVETKKFPGKIYGAATPVFLDDDMTCLKRLQTMGIGPGDIDYIVISHFHGDHIAGLLDFPDSGIWCSKKGLDYALGKKGFGAVRRGILNSLIPDNIYYRAKYPEAEFNEESILGFTSWKWDDDLFFVDLPGHFRGQIGLYLSDTDKGEVLLCGDAAWSMRSIREKIYPSRITSLFVDNYTIMSRTLDMLNKLNVARPGLRIIPSHCREAGI